MGYKSALDKHNLSYDKNLVMESPYENNTVYQSTEKLLRLSNPPTAILAGFAKSYDFYMQRGYFLRIARDLRNECS